MSDVFKRETVENVGQKIKMIRVARGWSQEILAKGLGISIPAVSKIESGVTDINLSRLEQIANIFHITVNQLLLLDELSAENRILSIKTLQTKLKEQETEINSLQRKLILLYEELQKRAIS